MTRPLFSLPLQLENDVVVARQRARQVAAQLGFEGQDQVRIATAVSEIVRNAFSYAGGGRVSFSVNDVGDRSTLVIDVADKGPGIEALDAILAGTYRSSSGLGLGIIGAKRLLDDIEISTKIGAGTTVRLQKHLPDGVELDGKALARLADTIRHLPPADAFSELREQNRALIEAGERLERQRAELRHLNETLEERVEAAIRARLQTEEQMRQAQKMDTIGQLTGGIAHDFNNMLAAVGSGMRLLEKAHAKGDGDLDRYIVAIRDALDRATSLTQRLMAFARHKPIAPEDIGLNDVVEGMRDLIVRTLGSGIRSEFNLAPGLGTIHVDASEVENALLNLCVNARDAMPGGGMLTVQTYRAEDAAEIVLAVSDTGHGMSAETLEKAFHPFFTTKEAGKGTGLGLAQVFGFAKQSGGRVEISSVVGEGTSVRVFLPV